MDSKTTLVVGDPHVGDNDNLRRFDILGQYIVDTQPDNIVIMGDFLDLDSLSDYDKNKRAKMEGRRFRKELDTGREAMDRMMSALSKYQKHQRKNKKKVYSPRKIYLIGNHEDRWERYSDTHAEMKDVVDIYEEIGLYKYKWEVVPYRKYYYISGIGFTHVPMNGLNKPVGGVTALRKATLEHDSSVVYGHSHQFGIETFTRRGSDNQVMAINVGCYFEGIPSYADGSLLSEDWWRGLVVLHHVEEGKVDVSTISLETLLATYI